MFGNKRGLKKIEGRGIQRRVLAHIKLTNEYVEAGMDREVASKRAYKEVVEMNITGQN